ncbi:hypothetical protein FISHEDRAFT_45271, partial [Fistulina hepatica ATCC 64428]
GRPRCFPYWQEFMKCYSQTDVPHLCKGPADDYFECLHRPKEVCTDVLMYNYTNLCYYGQRWHALRFSRSIHVTS